MVDRVRTVYSGLLTYDMHHSVLLDPGFFGPGLNHLWNDLDLDVVGVSAWFPLTDAPPGTVMSVEQAQAQYERIFNEHLVPLAARNPGPAHRVSGVRRARPRRDPRRPGRPGGVSASSSSWTRTATGSTTGAKPRPISTRACSAPSIGIPASSTGSSGGTIGSPATSAGGSSGRTYGRIPYAPSPAKRSFGRPIARTPSTTIEASSGAPRFTELREAGTPALPPPRSPTSYYAQIPLTVIDPNYSPQAIDAASADLDGDGNEDLIILGADYPGGGSSSYRPQPGRIYLGDGDGGFTQPPSGVFPIETLNTVHPREVRFDDLNGDGRRDMFVAAHGWDADPFPGEQNRLYLSRPGGGWRDATGELPQLEDFTHSAAMGDIRGRGLIDVVVGNIWGQNGILPYALLNGGDESFSLDRTILPVGVGETMNFNRGQVVTETLLTDLDEDGLPELVAIGDGSREGNPGSSVFWNRAGTYREEERTILPTPAPFVDGSIGLDAAAIDADGDGSQDVIVVGTQEDPFYDGWFVQLLMNRGERRFIDETSRRLQPDEWFGGSIGEASGAPWAQWVEVLDFNGDGASDFAVRAHPTRGQLPQNQPLIWLNDGAGQFDALSVRDFVQPGEEWRVSHALLMKTRHGYSFVVPQSHPGRLIVAGMLATRPYPQ